MTTREQITDRFQQINQDAKELSRTMWLAGLGTVGAVDEATRDLWSQLVERGKKVEVTGDLAKTVREAGERVGDRLNEARERVERGMQENMAGVLNRLGAPSRSDVQQLIDRVEKLTLKVEGLGKA